MGDAEKPAPPAPPAAWFYADPVKGAVGPYPHDEFRALALAGAMPPSTPVWRDGLEWRPLAEHGPAHLGIPTATLKQAGLAAARAAGGAGPSGAPPDEEEAALGDDDEPARSPPPSEREFVEDGSTFRWDSSVRRFVEVEDGEKAPRPPQDKKSRNKRTAADVLERRGGGGACPTSKKGGGKRDAAAAAGAGPAPPRLPTSVYVTGLPLDATEAEVVAAFGKCGLIRPAKTDPTGRTPAVKLYRDAASGALKGDAMVTFLKPPSVHLALTLLDGVPLRSGEAGQPAMGVSIAKFDEREGGGGGDAAPPAQAPPPAKRGRGPPPPNHAAALAARALAWDGFDDEAPPEQTTAVLRWGDPGLTASLIEGGKDALATFEASLAAIAGRVASATVGGGGGAVEGVRAYLGEPDRRLVATVRFRSPEGAAAAVAAFPGKPLSVGTPPIVGAELWDGVATWRARPAKKAVAVEEVAVERKADTDEDDDEAARLERFGVDIFGE